ncbi:MAG: VacJ family lipoprotein [Gammaproteobacteria bacterium]|nr:VacJ family lipoprotein [Gammaproteobacteria bacterium]
MRVASMGRAFGTVLVALAAFAAPATPAASADDPLEPLNRNILFVNGAFDRGVVRPVASGYAQIVPAPIRAGIGNFLDNLREPRTAINQLLQGRPGLAVADTARFLINSTLGIGGLFDPAAQMGLTHHREDFGQTFAVWGVEPGPYLMIPFVGSSNVRDAIGTVVGFAAMPQTYIDFRPRAGLTAMWVIRQRSENLHLDAEITGDPMCTYVRHG